MNMSGGVVISKELDLSVIIEFFESLFDIESPSPAAEIVLTEQKVRLVHELEKTLSVVWSAVSGNPHPSAEECDLLNKLQEMVGSLRHGMFESATSLHQPSLFSGYSTIFRKRSSVRRLRSVR
ncbi:MAG: hypothetical protein Q8L78_01740 [Coxiellaceae bacterium]|nr:hypothetical protein [Coxiellaceae bacterium]